MASREYRDHQRRNRGQEPYGDRQTGQSDWGGNSYGGPRGPHDFSDRDPGQPAQSALDRSGGWGRGSDFVNPRGASRHGPMDARYSEGFHGDASRFSLGGIWDESHQAGGRYDPDCPQWRDEQRRSLDQDDESWRADRAQKFSDEFNTWRSHRTQEGGKPQASEDAKDNNPS